MEFKWEAYFFLPERKFPQENGISWKVVQNFQPVFPNRKCVYHLRFSLVPSPTPILMRVTCYLVGVVQMVHANPKRNFSLGIFAYHLYKPSANRFSHVNGKQPLSSAKRDDDDTSIHIGITLFVLNHHLGSF